MANDEKVKFFRLIEIDKMIRAKDFPNSVTLSEKLEYSARTIKRDIEYLKDMMGAPIDFDRKRNGYYYTEEDYFLPAMHMTESDLIGMVLTSRILEQYKNTPIHKSLAGILKKFSHYLPDSITIAPVWLDHSFSFFDDPHSEIIPEIWETVFHGLQNKKSVKIWYKKPGTEKSTSRKIEIYHIICHKSEWYLIVFCQNNKEIRTYAVSRIQRADLLKENYSIPTDFSIENFMGSNFGVYPHEKDYKIDLVFSNYVAHLIKERAWNQDWEIVDLENGDIRLKMNVGHLLELKSWILSWGKEVEVIGPDELREMILDELLCIGNVYQKQ